MNIKSTHGMHGGFDIRAGGDEKLKIYFAWPYEIVQEMKEQFGQSYNSLSLQSDSLCLLIYLSL